MIKLLFNTNFIRNNNSKEKLKEKENVSSSLQRKILSDENMKKKLDAIFQKRNKKLNEILVSNFGNSKKVPDSWG